MHTLMHREMQEKALKVAAKASHGRLWVNLICLGIDLGIDLGIEGGLN